MTAREEVLRRVRTALAAVPDAAEPTRTYATVGALEATQLLDLLETRLIDYGATVRRCDLHGVGDAVVAALTAGGSTSVVVATGLEPGWRPQASAALRVLDEPEVTDIPALVMMDAVLTSASVAVAATGTLVLDGSAGQGRRATSLIPDHHVCVVRMAQVVESVPEAVSRLTATRPLTWVSGPSATSDIELRRVEGVHGPRRLEVILVREAVPD